tara:strand:- start:416 stop:1771 length:1356 start_codon:yes stop_codon:yes gene_type:complete
MQVGLGAFGALSLPGMLRLRAENGVAADREKTAVIQVWKPGGCSHIDTYDPKPEAAAEYRGPFGTIKTSVPGTHFTELLPLQAKLAHKLTVIRSMVNGAGGHPAGSMQMFTGDTDRRDKPKVRLPSWMSVANYMRGKGGNRDNILPRYIGVPAPGSYSGTAYVGDAYGPFNVTGNPNNSNFSVPNIGLDDLNERVRVGRRVSLRESLDTLERAFDRAGETEALDEFEQQAMTLLTNPKARDAFDLSKESDATRDRYGRNQWGQQLLLARRLVEAGVDVITSNLSGPLCGRVNNWDDHAVNHHVFDAMKFRAPTYDQAVSALIEDIYDRGLDKRVLVVVTGEFGRTPKVNYQPSTGAGNASAPAGTKQPGRDHWPRAFSNIWFGGGIDHGKVVGASDKRGEDAISSRYYPQDFIATIYQHLGIDYHKITIKDFNGRPTPIIDTGRAIPELTA